MPHGSNLEISLVLTGPGTEAALYPGAVACPDLPVGQTETTCKHVQSVSPNPSGPDMFFRPSCPGLNIIPAAGPGDSITDAATVDAAPDMIDCDLAAEVADMTNEETILLIKRLRSQDRCGRGAVVGLSPDLTKAILIPLRCKSWDCRICARLKRQAWVTKLARGNPSRVMTLTADPQIADNIKTRAALMKRAFLKLITRIRHQVALHPSLRWMPPRNRRQLIRALAKRGKVLKYTRKPEVEYALAWELAGTNHLHCHVLLRSPYIPQGWLSYQWSKLGIGTNVHIKQARSARWEALHAAKNLDPRRPAYMPDPEDYVTKDCPHTAAALAPMRIIQISQNWILPETEPPADKSRFDWTFAYSSHDADEILVDWLTHHSVISYTRKAGGVYELTKIPQTADIEFITDDPDRFELSR